MRSLFILLIIRCLSFCLTTNPSNSYHLPYILLNQVPLSACLTKLFAYANPFASHHSIKSLPASFILPTLKSPHSLIPRTPPPHIRVPITSDQQPLIPTHTQLALQVSSAALVRHQTSWYTATNLTPLTETAVTLS